MQPNKQLHHSMSINGRLHPVPNCSITSSYWPVSAHLMNGQELQNVTNIVRTVSNNGWVDSSTQGTEGSQCKRHRGCVKYIPITTTWLNQINKEMYTLQGDHSPFSTMIFHDFSMTKRNEFPWSIGTAYFFKINNTWLWMLTRIKIYFQLFVNQSVSKTSETTKRMIFTKTKILVHFYKKIPGHHHHFPWLSPWPWLFSMTFEAWKVVLLNSMTFHDFPGRVVTLTFNGN